jgi:hypothetical protein
MSNYYPERPAPERPRGFRARVAALLHKEQQSSGAAEQRDHAYGEEARIESDEPPMPSR